MRDPAKWELTEEGEALEYKFQREYGSEGNCSCHLSAPCSSCTHPGNPIAIEETDEYWQPVKVDHKAELKKFLHG